AVVVRRRATLGQPARNEDRKLMIRFFMQDTDAESLLAVRHAHRRLQPFVAIQHSTAGEWTYTREHVGFVVRCSTRGTQLCHQPRNAELRFIHRFCSLESRISSGLRANPEVMAPRCWRKSAPALRGRRTRRCLRG